MWTSASTETSTKTSIIFQHLEHHATARQFTGLSLSPRFNSRPDHMELVADKMALWHGFSQYFNFPQHYSTYASYPHFSHLPPMVHNLRKWRHHKMYLPPSPSTLSPLYIRNYRQPTNCSYFKMLYINCSYRKLSTHNNSTTYLQKRPSEHLSPASCNTNPNRTLELSIHDTVMTIIYLKMWHRSDIGEN
jgi:hypothetical protein